MEKAVLSPLTQSPSLFASVDLFSLPLNGIIGVPELASVIVFLVFIGSNCGAACKDLVDMMIRFRSRANANGPKQVEFVVVSAHKTIEDFAEFMRQFSPSIPIFSIDYDQEAVRHEVLRSFGFDPVDYSGEFVPDLAVMEWLGARSEPLVPGPVQVCNIIRDPKKYIEKALDTPVSFEMRINGLKDQCSFVFAEIRDTLYHLRLHPSEQVGYLEILKSIANGFVILADPSHSLPPTVVEQIQSDLKTWFKRVMQISMNSRIVRLIDSSTSSPNIRPTFFADMIARQTKAHEIIQQRARGVFPQLTLIPELPMFNIKIYYRTREWSVITERFPRNIVELTELARDRIDDLQGDVIKLYSDELNPRLMDDPDNSPDGYTEKSGSFSYSSFEEIAPRLGELYFGDSKALASGLIKIRVVVMGTQNKRNLKRPVVDKTELLSQLETMQARVKADPDLSLSFIQKLFSASIVMKLIELDEFQEEALRRIPVVQLHMQAVHDVLSARKVPRSSTGGGGSTFSVGTPPLSSLGGGLEDFMYRRSFKGRSGSGSDSSESGSESMATAVLRPVRLSYQEAFLKQLVDWFRNRYYTWIPARIRCSATEGCCGTMRFTAVDQVDDQLVDDCGKPIEVEVFKTYIREIFNCNTCKREFMLLRPVHDIVKMMQFSQGRCGEHAKSFALAVRALGYDVRLIVGKFLEKDSKANYPVFGSLDMDHIWNEVYLEADTVLPDGESRWIHVDVSAKADAPIESGGLGLSPDMAYGHPEAYDLPMCVGRLLGAGAVGKDFVSLVTNRYLVLKESVLLAEQQMEPRYTASAVAKLSRIVGSLSSSEEEESLASSRASTLPESVLGPRVDTPVISHLPPRAQKEYIAHLESSERVHLRNMHDRIPEPKRGKAEFYENPQGLIIFVHGGEIPLWTKRRASGIFSSYDFLQTLGSRETWRVCRVDVCKLRDAVNQIRFGYCFGRETEPSKFSSTLDQFAFDEEEHAIQSWQLVVASCDCATTVVPEGHFVSDLRTTLNGSGLVANVEVVVSRHTESSSEAATASTEATPTHSIIGIFGARRDPKSLSIGIEFIGIYSVDSALDS